MSRPLRDDSRRNRALVINAAAMTFFEDGGDNLHAEIARRTGLSRSTVYRHGGDRQELAGAVIDEFLAILKDSAGAVLDGRSSIRDLLFLVLSTAASMGPLVDLMAEVPEQDRARYTTTIIRTVTPAFEAARDEGRLHREARPEDLGTLLTMVVAASTTEPNPDEVKRVVGYLLDGLVTPAGHEA